MNNAVGGFFRLLLSCSAIAAADGQFTRAAEPPDTDEENTVVITATRTPTPLENVGSAVTILTREQIEKAQARTVADVLRTVPGVNVIQSGPPGGQNSVFLRGLNSNQTLFLIDGARITSPLNGLVTLSNLTPDQLERIEVVRGPQSTLYGADAMGGVINLITRQAAGRANGSAMLEGGTYD